jgi:transcriptional regulator with XRE-family HTH domain
MNKQGARTEENLALRKEGGLFIKALRTHAGLTQREVAVALKMNYYTMIAQMEAGTARIPPDTYIPYAKVLGVDPEKFVRKLMQYYDPHTYKALWGNTKIEMLDLLS